MNNAKAIGIREIAGMDAATGIAMIVDHADLVPIKALDQAKAKVSATTKPHVLIKAKAKAHVPIKETRGKLNLAQTKRPSKRAIAAAAGKNGATVSRSGKTAVAALKARMRPERKLPQAVIPKAPTHRHPWFLSDRPNPLKASLSSRPKATDFSASAHVPSPNLLRIPSSVPNSFVSMVCVKACSSKARPAKHSVVHR